MGADWTGCWFLVGFALLGPQFWSLRLTQTHQSGRAESLLVRFDILCPQKESWSSGPSPLSQSLAALWVYKLNRHSGRGHGVHELQIVTCESQNAPVWVQLPLRHRCEELTRRSTQLFERELPRALFPATHTKATSKSYMNLEGLCSSWRQDVYSSRDKSCC